MIRVLIVDDHQLVRQGIAALLMKADGIQVIGDAKDGRDGVIQAEQLCPDVILMDIEMPYMDGLRATHKLVDEHCSAHVLILSMRSDEATAKQAALCGADGYLVKNSTREEMISAIRAVADGKIVASPEVAPFFERKDRRMRTITLAAEANSQ